MSESGDSWDPGPWKGWSYTSARAAHDPSAGRGYGSRAGNASSAYDSSGRSYAATPPKSVSTDSPSPLVIAVDVTGSMGVFPETMFKKLPLLDLEMKEYLDNPEICFIAVGDAYCDSHPLQVQEFAKGKDLVDRLNGIHIEGGGGGQIMESYDLATVYGAHNIKMPKANRPIFIYVGDEGFYDTVDPDQAKRLAHVELEKRLTSKQAVDDLKKKFSAVYCVRKLYDGSDADHMSSIDKTLHAQWTKYLGDDKVVILNEPGRICDVIFGILAAETDKVDYFTKELSERQTKAQVGTVMKALSNTIDNSHLSKKTKSPMKSVLRSKST